LPGIKRLVLTPGKDQKRYLAGAFTPWHGRLAYVEGDRKVGWLSMNPLRALPAARGPRHSPDSPCGPRQVHHRLEPDDARVVGRVRQQAPVPLLATLPPQREPDRRLGLDLLANVTRHRPSEPSLIMGKREESHFRAYPYMIYRLFGAMIRFRARST